ncbi:hypothetical protein D3C81_1479780 [compost metagenome]
MKAITIIQPFATLVALEEKRLETRSWFTKYRGPLAIHAGKKIDKKICQQEPYKSILTKYGFTADNLPTGAVLAVCQLKDCHQVVMDMQDHAMLDNNSIVTDQEYLFGDYSLGRFAWQLTDMMRLQEPIEINGKQGLWNLSLE